MLYLHNVHWIDPDSFVVRHTDIAVEQGPEGRLFLDVEIPHVRGAVSQERIIDGGGRFATKSLVCGHHHIYSALSRGMPMENTSNFLEILEKVWWRLDKLLDKEMIEASALYCAAACAKNGVTFIMDHHASPHSVEGSLGIIAKAFDKVGVGHLLCYEISNRDGEAIARQCLEESQDYLASGGRGHVGLHASFTVDDALLKDAVDLAHKQGTGIHIHVAEDKSDQAHCLEKYGKRVVQRLHEAGVLDIPQSILGHCVHVDEDEVRLLQKSPCFVVQNVESNLNNNVGLGRYSMLPQVMLGTDGMHSDMIRSSQAAYFNAAQAKDSISPLAAYERLRAGHKHVAVHERNGKSLGDGPNNIVLLDYDSPTPVEATNFPAHFMYGLSSKHVHSVISQGHVIVENGNLVSMNEEGILQNARQQAQRLWANLQGA